jgi:8-oxo-dGTP pyrophosphatase MutT (NUDIX family)
MIWKPHVTVAAVIERQGRFLLVDEFADGARVLNQPAGHLDEGETLVEAIMRETLEETAWHFTPTALVGIYRWRDLRKNTTFLRVTFCGQADWHDSARRLDAGIIGSEWMTREQLVAEPQRLRSPMVLRCVDDYLSGARHALSILSEIS